MKLHHAPIRHTTHTSLRLRTPCACVCAPQTPSPTLQLPKQATTQSWQLNTYVDDSLRIVRGDGGAVFVFKKRVPLPEAVVQPQTVPPAAPVPQAPATH